MESQRGSIFVAEQSSLASSNRKRASDDPEENQKRARVSISPRAAATEKLSDACGTSLCGPEDAVIVTIAREPVTKSDLKTLCGSGRLNDRIMNAYLALILERNRARPSLPRVHAMNTHFYDVFTKKNYSGVARWTKHVDLFALDTLLVPIFVPGHWCLVVVNFCGKQIRYLDSLGGRNDRCLQDILSYLSQEMRAKKGGELKPENWELKTVENLPQQNNDYDCGVFALKFADYAARGVEHNFGQADMQYFRERMLVEILQTGLIDGGYGNVWLL